MKSILLLTTLLSLGYATLHAQSLEGCKNPCKKTRIVRSGPFMGLRTLTLPDSLYVRVVEVVKNGPSIKNGILLNDTLTHFNGKVIKNMTYFIGEVAKLQPGDTISVTAVRNGIPTVYTYPLGALKSQKVTEIVCCDEPEPVTKPKRKPKREVEPVQAVGPDIEPELETEPPTKNEPKPKRKAKREVEPVQAVGPDIEPELESEPFRTAPPAQNPKPEPEPIPTPTPQPIPASEAQPLTELKQNNLAFILSPTPAKEYLFINCYEEIKTEVTLDIQDLNGKLVFSEKVSKMKGNFEAKMDISTLPDGVYFVKIYVENTDYVQRFVKGK